MGRITATSLSGSEIGLDDGAVDDLEARLRGPLLRAGDEGYDDVRTIWNGMIDKRPALVTRCTGVADVIDAVRFARDHDLLLAVRGGGHNVAGNAVCDGGLVIDLSLMNRARVDPATRRVRAGGGATWGDVDRETQVFGLATPGGVVSLTGIGGLTLCGGLGWLRRRFGLSCDALVGADVVTADGEVVTATERDNADLLWALRGGGGNFGVVTSFDFELHEVGPVVTLCAAMYPLEEGDRILPAWRDFMGEAPEAISSNLLVWSLPAAEPFPAQHHGKPVVIVAAVHSGDLDEGERLLRPLRELSTPLVDLSGPAPYCGVQSAFDPFFQKAERLNYWKSRYVDRLDAEVIDAFLARARERPSPWVLLAIWHLGGAMSRVAPGDTAFGARDAPWLLSIDAGWTDPARSEQAIAWTRAFWEQSEAWSEGRGAYLNFPGFGEEGEALLRASYGSENYDRLAAIKRRYDPTNLFRLNQNIPPSP